MENISSYTGWHKYKVPELEVVDFEVAIEKEQNEIKRVSAIIHVDALKNGYIPIATYCYNKASAIPT